MIFGGIRKLTLIDYPGKTACTLFTPGCNFRCPFCHNASLVCGDGEGRTIDAMEVLGFLETRQGLLDGVVISGGEPLLHRELGAFIGEVKALGYPVKLDTNGSYPDELKALVRSGAVDYVAMDIKNAPENYARTIGAPDYDLAPVEESRAFLLSGAVPFEFRTTVVREFHSAEDLVALARWISPAENYYLQGFIDSGEVLQSGLHGYTAAEMRQFLDKIHLILPTAELRGI
ncbi:MAG: anaerobic ribonucleoside-triphosphate reductase activating protein [Clostridiales Family XIII bacterium]|nr:anaerobic ribonucleoside-triphosphate reductase activating protein [Clostridiales Family XIII bacterium]